MLLPLLPSTRGARANGFVMAWLGSSFLIAQLISAPRGECVRPYGAQAGTHYGLSASEVAYVVSRMRTHSAAHSSRAHHPGRGRGTVGVIQAYVSDVVERRTARRVGWLSAATNVV